ncbi:hypothetical protein KKG72_08465 [bacterium]|nr:hypothetical protein [bacterium]MBU1995201.1 hypothetical protein [bacterium]
MTKTITLACGNAEEKSTSLATLIHTKLFWAKVQMRVSHSCTVKDIIHQGDNG